MYASRPPSLLRWFLPLATVLLSVFLLSACGGSDNNSVVNTVAAANSTLPANTFTATLSGTVETPPNASAATGTGVVIIDPATRIMKATLITAGIVANAAHLHEGAPGVAGPIIFPLVESPVGSGIWTTQATLSDAQVTSFKAGNFYFNAHSLAFPSGEIRGQIRTQLPVSTTSLNSLSNTTSIDNRYVSYINVLNGSQEVPATTSQATALAITIIDTLANTLTGAVTSSGLTGNAAAIYAAPAGVAGPAVFGLVESAIGSGAWIIRTSVSNAQLAALNANNYYYEIRSLSFPNGELRGQIISTVVSLGTIANPGLIGAAIANSAGALTAATGVTNAATVSPSVAGSTAGLVNIYSTGVSTVGVGSM